MAKVLQDAFGITVGTMTTIHAYRHPVAGGRAARKDLRASGRRRKTLSAHYRRGKSHWHGDPALSGKLKGHAQRVPTKTGSVTELVSVLEKR